MARSESGLHENDRCFRSTTIRASPSASPKTGSFHGFISTPLNKVGEGAVDDLIRLLRDGSPSVVREAKRQLEEFLGDVPGESLFAVVNEANNDDARRCAVQLIFDKGKWQSLPWLLRIASQADEPSASMARRFIEAWFSPPLCNKVFTKPSAAEKKAIDEAMDGLRTQHDEAFLAKVQEWLRAA